MTQKTIPQGVYTAIVTPFLEDDSIDWLAYEKIVAHQVQGGVCGIVVSGTTGESPTLDTQEKLSLIKKTRALVGSKIHVMAGTGGNNTKQTVELSKLAMDAGADSLLIVTPPYNKPSMNGLLEHYRTIAQATKAPLCLYHVPGRTNVLLSAEKIAAICAIPGVCSVKEASGDVTLFSDTVQKTKNTTILSGDDFTFLPSLSVGGKGLISVMSNVFPKETVELYNAFEAKDFAKALQIHNALFNFMKALFVESNPTPAKKALEFMGLCSAKVRLPLALMEEKNVQILHDSFQEAKRNLNF